MKIRRNRFPLLAVVGLALPLYHRAEGAPGAAPAAPGAPGSAPGAAPAPSYQPPAGHVLVKESDYRGSTERLTAYEQRMQKLGVKDLAELEPMADLFKPENRTRVQQMMGLLTPAAQQRVEDKAASGNMSREDVIKMVAEETAKAEAKRTYSDAEKSHMDTASPKKVREYIQAQAKEMLGDGVDEETVAAFVAEAYGRVHMAREDALESKDPAKLAAYMYPEGHPLRGSYLAPFNAENMKSVIDGLKDSASKRTGAVLGRIGRAAASAPARSTPAGSRVGADVKDTKGKPSFADVTKRMVADADKATA